MGVNRFMRLEEMDRIVQSVFPTQIDAGSIADRLIKQERKAGLEEGVLVDKVQTLQDLVGDRVSSKEELLWFSVPQSEQILLTLQNRLRSRQ